MESKRSASFRSRKIVPIKKVREIQRHVIRASGTLRRWKQATGHSESYRRMHKINSKEHNHLIEAADFLRFLKQRTGWMGPSGCLVPPDYCHEYHLERSSFSIALERANDYLANQGLRPDQLLSPEAESRIMDNWPPEFETLRNLATVKEIALPEQEFKTGLNEMLQVMKKRVPTVQTEIAGLDCGEHGQETLEKVGLRLQPETYSLWGSRRQVNQRR